MLLLLTLILNLAHASEPVKAPSVEEVCSAHLKAREATDLQLANNNFFVKRNLELYKTIFGADFASAVARLGSGDTWIDMGAGLAVAMTNYLHSTRHAVSDNYVPASSLPNLIALSVERPRRNSGQLYGTRAGVRDYVRRAHYLEKMLEEFESHFTYLEGKKVEDMKVSEIAPAGTVALITDLYGPLSYSSELVAVLTRYGLLLKTGGQLHIKVHHPSLEIYLADGQILTLFQYLEQYATGFRVEYGDKQPVIIRTADPLSFTPVKVRKYIASSPAEIEYQL